MNESASDRIEIIDPALLANVINARSRFPAELIECASFGPFLWTIEEDSDEPVIVAAE